MTSRRPVASAVLALALLVVGCSSAGREGDSAPPTTRPSVDGPVKTVVGAAPLAVVFGDSNTVGTGAQLSDALTEAGFTPDVRGISGSGLKDNATDWLPAAAAIAAARPAVVVVALGTNDVVTLPDVRAFPKRAETLLAALGDVPVVWVTHVDSGGGRTPKAARAVNDTIRALPEEHPNVTALDLGPLLTKTPGLLGPDRIHYVGRGRTWFADKVATAAQQAANGG